MKYWKTLIVVQLKVKFINADPARKRFKRSGMCLVACYIGRFLLSFHYSRPDFPKKHAEKYKHFFDKMANELLEIYDIKILKDEVRISEDVLKELKFEQTEHDN